MAFPTKYTDQEREAIGYTYAVRGVKPARRITELAAAGDLTDAAGQKLPAFDVPVPTVKSYGERYAKRMTAQTVSGVAQLAHDAAMEAIRVRLVDMAAKKLDRAERAFANNKAKDPTESEILGLVRVYQELRRDITKGSPTKPGPKSNTEKEEAAQAEADKPKPRGPGALAIALRTTSPTE